VEPAGRAQLPVRRRPGKGSPAVSLLRPGPPPAYRRRGGGRGHGVRRPTPPPELHGGRAELRNTAPTPPPQRRRGPNDGQELGDEVDRRDHPQPSEGHGELARRGTRGSRRNRRTVTTHAGRNPARSLSRPGGSRWARTKRTSQEAANIPAATVTHQNNVTRRSVWIGTTTAAVAAERRAACWERWSAARVSPRA
jgi:hypothetical protein